MTSGMPLHGNVSIPEDNVSHQPAPPNITGEPHGIAKILSSPVFTSSREQSSQIIVLKGKDWCHFALPPALTLLLRYFPRLFGASSLH